MKQTETITTTFRSDLGMTPEIRRALTRNTPLSIATKYAQIREERKSREAKQAKMTARQKNS